MREYFEGTIIMKEKIDLIMIPFHDYKKWITEGFRTRDSHLFEEFKTNKNINNILIINRPVSLPEIILKRHHWKSKIGKKILGSQTWQLNKIDEKVYCLDIFSFSIFKILIQKKKWWNTVFYSKRVLKIINETLEFLNMNNRVLFLENPMAIGVAKNIDKKIFAFDAIDNWLYHPQMSNIKSVINANYKYISNNADIIFTVSQSLYEYFFKSNKNAYWIPNGVDSDRFLISIVKNHEKRKNPIIGYMGKIQDRVDFDLIEECLKKYPQNEFLVIGPVYSQMDKIRYLKKKYSNILFLGDIHYDKLPAEMKKFDIAIIPHKVDEFTNSMNPLKIYEYLAAGKQIITTKIAGAGEFSKFLYQANNNNEFVALIKKAIKNYNEIDDISDLVVKELKEENMWHYKADMIVNKIIDIIEGD